MISEKNIRLYEKYIDSEAFKSIWKQYEEVTQKILTETGIRNRGLLKNLFMLYILYYDLEAEVCFYNTGTFIENVVRKFLRIIKGLSYLIGPKISIQIRLKI